MDVVFFRTIGIVSKRSVEGLLVYLVRLKRHKEHCFLTSLDIERGDNSCSYMVRAR
jgi:hypothetical protein